MSDSIFEALFENGGIETNLDDTLKMAAEEGYIILSAKTYTRSACEKYEVEDLLLPDPGDLSRQAKFNCGDNEIIAPKWFSYSDYSNKFSYNDKDFAAAFIASKKLTRTATGFIMDDKNVSADDVKKAVLKSISIVEAHAGFAAGSAYKAILASCPTSKASSSDLPVWYDVVRGDIRESDFSKYLAEKTGWVRAGRIVRDPNGQFVSSDMVKRTIFDEISPYCPTGTGRRVSNLFKALLLCLPSAQAENALDLVTAKELASSEIKAPAFAVKGLLPAGLTVLAAPPKIGKSWLCLALADAIATGSTFMGYEVNAGSVLYLALEDSKFRVKDRLKSIGSTMPDNLQIATSGARRLDDGLLLQLETWIKSTPTSRLIVVDTLARVRPMTATGLDAYSSDTATIAPLQALALANDVAILLVTHFSKAKQITADADPFDRITGSNGLFGVADAAWLIYGKRGGDDYTFKTTGRDSLDNELSIAFDKVSCKWQLLGSTDELQEQKRIDAYHANPLVQTVIELVNEGGRWEGSASDLSEEVARRKQVFIGDARETGALLSEFAKYLVQVDGIVFAKGTGGRRGRNYSFERSKPLA